jgi:glycosyltransferase involved in cell wall biosynthesis
MKGLKYVSWSDTTGYAVAAKAYLYALIDASINVTWTPMVPGEKNYVTYLQKQYPCPILQTICNLEIDYDTVIIHTVPEYYPEWIAKERSKNCKILGYTVWEHERLPDHWPAILNQLDGVMVPCKWNAEVFRNSGVTVPIHVVAHISQFERSTEVSKSDQNVIRSHLGEYADQGRFIFYSIGHWSNRKAPFLAIEAFLKAFDSHDNVLMVVKTSAKDITRWQLDWRNGFRRRNPSPQISAKRITSKYPASAPVVVIADESLSDAEILALHQEGDCFVSMARPEGWGLGAFEAARLAKPIIMTGYGGQLDFLNPQLCYLIDYKMVPVYEPIWSANYRSTDLWAEPSIDHAIQLMRKAFRNPEHSLERAKQLANEVRTNFSQQVIMLDLLQALDSIDDI